jgi:hypothetical protein
MNLDDQVSHMMNELEPVQDTLAKLVALYPESLSYADLRRRLTLMAVGDMTAASTGLIIAFMSPVVFTPEKECYSVLILQFSRRADIKRRKA